MHILTRDGGSSYQRNKPKVTCYQMDQEAQLCIYSVYIGIKTKGDWIIVTKNMNIALKDFLNTDGDV